MVKYRSDLSKVSCYEESGRMEQHLRYIERNLIEYKKIF